MDGSSISDLFDAPCTIPLRSYQERNFGYRRRAPAGRGPLLGR